jgi:hypothetical protein
MYRVLLFEALEESPLELITHSSKLYTDLTEAVGAVDTWVNNTPCGIGRIATVSAHGKTYYYGDSSEDLN